MKVFLRLFFFTFSACSTEPLVVTKTNITAATANKVYIVSHGWHTGLVVESKLIKALIPQLQQRFATAPYIEFGWGDKGFYQAEDITVALTIQAIFWPTESVIHAVAITEKPEIYFSGSDIENICLDKRQYSRLIDFIKTSFLQNNNGDIIKLSHGIYGDSQFYKGQGDYYLMNTCNKWTAKALKSAGLPISTTFKLTASSVMSFLTDYKKYAIKTDTLKLQSCVKQ